MCEAPALCMAIRNFYCPVSGLELTIRLRVESLIEPQIHSKVSEEVILNLLKNLGSRLEMNHFD